MKKKIIFMVINMNIGGTEKALLNMISVMPKESYDLTILMLEEYGGFLDSIPEWVNIKYIDGYENIKEYLNESPRLIIRNFLKRWKLVKAFIFIYLYLLSLIMKNRSYFFKYILRKYPIIKDEYDIAVAYAGPMDFISFFVLKKIKSKKKYQWIHFDITKIAFNRSYASKIYKKFDKILVVSEEGRVKVNEILPSLKTKTVTFKNELSSDMIKKMADEGEGFSDNFKGMRILTVGRLSEEKGQDLTIPVLSRLRQEGFNIRWYCIGEGSARSRYEKMIKGYGVEKDYLLLGSKPNPYPYMKQCDIYVQSSRHEGYCITLGEARCFNIPIISTNFTGAKEQIIHTKNGLIVESDINQIYSAVKHLLMDNCFRNKLQYNIDKEKEQRYPTLMEL